MLLLDEVRLVCPLFVVLISSISFLVFLASVLQFNRRISALILSNEGNALRIMLYEGGIEGICDSLKRLLLFGVIGVGLEQAFVNGDEKLAVIRGNDLYLIGQLWILPSLMREVYLQRQGKSGLLFHPLFFPEGG